MATTIGLPKLSPTMEEGVLAKWHKKVGDKVSPGDVVAEVETDKANMDFTLEEEGVILKLLVAEGDTVKLGAPVAIIGEAGEDTSAAEASAKAAPKPAEKTEEKPKEKDEKAEAAEATEGATEDEEPTAENAPAKAEKPDKADKPAAKVATSTEKPVEKPTEKAPAKVDDKSAEKAAPAAGGGLLASPLAKTLAAENGVDLRALTGSGPGGRIVERDVRAAMSDAQQPVPGSVASRISSIMSELQSATKAAATPAPARSTAPAQPLPPLVPATTPADVDKNLSPMRKTIARRLLEAKQTIPHFSLTAECDAAPLLAFRAQLNAILGDEAKASLNDLIVKACALALRRVPTANASFLGDKIRIHGAVHVGVAVSIDDGLVTPVIRHTDQKGIARIAAEMKDLAARARVRKLMPEEMTGSTFTVSNLGMFGVDEFKAIINPPESVILAVGAVKRKPVVDASGAIVAGDRLTLSFSCDHRVVDGALGARLMAELVKIIEHPAALAA